MLGRAIETEIRELLNNFPAVAILGPRQVGKTTLALEISKTLLPKSLYLDLEMPSDLQKLSDPESYFSLHRDKLIILDEVQRTPDLFPILRGVIDQNRRAGRVNGQFLILGSASLELLKQSSETLAGRIAYIQLPGLNAQELSQQSKSGLNDLWLRGGFPDSFLARSDQLSMRWRLNFINTYLEREVPQFGPRVPASTLRVLWTMLAHSQGAQINMSKLGRNIGTSTTSARRYVELLEDLFLIRSLRPWSGNVGKRLVKNPKVYIRDSGLVHALLNINSIDDLLSHPVVGNSWEGFVIENLLSVLPLGASAWFYRTSAGAEIDFLVEYGSERIAFEIKRSVSPKVSKGYHLACDDVKASKRVIVYSGNDTYGMKDQIEVASLDQAMSWVASM